MGTLYMGELNKGMDESNVSIETPEDMQNKEPTKKPDILHGLRTRYASSFTMHALNHIQEGIALEKIVWIVKLLGLFAAAIFICWGLFTGFLSHEVNTTIKTSMKTSLNFPKMYLCTNIKDQLAGGMQSPNYVEVRPPPYDPDKPDAIVHPPGTQLIPRGHCVYGGVWTCNKPTHFGHCIVVNDDETLKQKAGKYTDSPGIKAYRHGPMNINQPLELWISTGEWKWGQGVHREAIPQAGIYSVKLSKTIYHRLPAPYTNCVVDGSDRDLSYSMFKGQYSFEKCARTCQIRAELEECRFIRNENTIYMRNEEYKKLANYTGKKNMFGKCNRSFNSNKKFIQRVDECIAKCPPPCEETRYDVSVSYNKGVKNTWGKNLLDNNFLWINLEFKDFIVTEIEQHPAYELTALIANFGGTLGLMCGMSAVSILELIIWFFLSVALAIFQLYKKLT